VQPPHTCHCGQFSCLQAAWNCVQSGKREVCPGKERKEREDQGEGEVRRVCMCVCVQICVFLCVIVVYVCMGVYMCMYVCMFVCMESEFNLRQNGH